jgi:hypothetical protein
MQHSTLSPERIIAQTREWVKTVVIGYQFCPFANKVFEAQTIHYQVVTDHQLEACLQALIVECQKLDNSNRIETTIIIYPQGYTDFEYFLELLALAEDLLVAQGYEGIYQLASFHPQYQFSDTDIDDPANYTNRSPYPMLHLLRETSLEQAIADYPDAHNIPQRNIENARKLGIKQLVKALASCL